MGRVPSASRGSGASAGSPRANARAIPPAATAREASEETAIAPAPTRSVAVAARARRVARDGGARSARASTPREAASRSVARRGAPSAPGACVRGGGMASRDAGTREHECGWLTTAMGCYSGRRLGKLVSRDRLVSWPSGGEENPTGRKVDQKTRPFPVSSSVWVKKISSGFALVFLLLLSHVTSPRRATLPRAAPLAQKAAARLVLETRASSARTFARVAAPRGRSRAPSSPFSETRRHRDNRLASGKPSPRRPPPPRARISRANDRASRGSRSALARTPRIVSTLA